MTVRALLLAGVLFTDSVSRAQEPPLAPPPLAEPAPPELVLPPQPPAELPPPLGPGVLRLHLEAPAGILLKRDAGPPVRVFDASGLHVAMGPLCAAPCDVVIDARGNNRFVFGGGDNTPDSATLSLGELGGPVTARVFPGNKALRALAGVSAGLGLVSEYVAYLTLTSTPTRLVSNSTRDLAPARNFALAGVGLLVTGAVLHVVSRTTYVLEPEKSR